MKYWQHVKTVVEGPGTSDARLFTLKVECLSSGTAGSLIQTLLAQIFAARALMIVNQTDYVQTSSCLSLLSKLVL